MCGAVAADAATPPPPPPTEADKSEFPKAIRRISITKLQYIILYLYKFFDCVRGTQRPHWARSRAPFCVLRFTYGRMANGDDTIFDCIAMLRRLTVRGSWVAQYVHGMMRDAFSIENFSLLYTNVFCVRNNERCMRWSSCRSFDNTGHHYAHARIRCDRINRYVQVGDWIAYICISCDVRINNKTRLIYLRYRPMIWSEHDVYRAMACHTAPRRTTPLFDICIRLGCKHTHTHTFLVKHCKTNRFCIPKLLSLTPNIVDNIQYVHLEHFVPAGNLQNISTWTHMRTHYSHIAVSGASAAMNNGHQPKHTHTHTDERIKKWDTHQVAMVHLFLAVAIYHRIYAFCTLRQCEN